MDQRVVAIIPARAGSKGIINKNIIDFCGKPLVAWSIEQAKNAQNVEEVFVSTDGENIAEIAQEYGAKVIRRPKELASDVASSEDALLHAINEIRKEMKIDNILFLQATSPVRLCEDIEQAIDIFFREQYDSLFSMSILEDYCLWKKEGKKLVSWTYDYMNRGRRQEREKLYLENGSIYVFKSKLIEETHNRLGGKIGMYEMPLERSGEIDSEDDITICENYMRKYYNFKNNGGK